MKNIEPVKYPNGEINIAATIGRAFDDPTFEQRAQIAEQRRAQRRHNL